MSIRRVIYDLETGLPIPVLDDQPSIEEIYELEKSNLPEDIKDQAILNWESWEFEDKVSRELDDIRDNKTKKFSE